MKRKMRRRKTRRPGKADCIMNSIVRPLEPADRERWNELWRGYLQFYKHDLPADLTT